MLKRDVLLIKPALLWSKIELIIKQSTSVSFILVFGKMLLFYT